MRDLRTLQVEAKGLRPLTDYTYQFTVCGSDNKSPLGKTKTAPAEDDDVSELSFAVFSCSNYRMSSGSSGSVTPDLLMFRK